jgi:uncharacterized membrane protein
MAEEAEASCEPQTWTFRGYELDPSSFTTAMVHFYRGEMQRANVWRTRLDTTTNWAVITTAAALTFVFGEPTNPHYVFLMVWLLVLTFLMIEARRYRYYALWAYRVHLMETDFLASIFTPPFHPSSDWGGYLAESLTEPAFRIRLWQAVGRRFRRNYVWLMSLLILSWVLKLTVHPSRTASLSTVMDRAAVGPVAGPVIAAVVAVMYGTLVLLAVAASLSRTWKGWPELLRRVAGPLTPEPRPKERLATIITSKGQAVAGRILEELGRGVTALEGIGMYTGTPRVVLLCAVTSVQVAHLRDIVGQVDPDAFVVVSVAEEVRGAGFRPFEPPS